MTPSNPWQVRNEELLRRVQEEIGQAVSRNLTGRFVVDDTRTGRVEAPKKARVRIRRDNEVTVSDADLNAYNAVKSIVDDGKAPVAASQAAEDEFTAEELATFLNVGRRLAMAARKRLAGKGGSIFTGISIEADGEMHVHKRTIEAGLENMPHSSYNADDLLRWLNTSEPSADDIYRTLIDPSRPRVIKGCDCPMCRDTCTRNGIPADFDFARYR